MCDGEPAARTQQWPLKAVEGSLATSLLCFILGKMHEQGSASCKSEGASAAGLGGRSGYGALSVVGPSYARRPGAVVGRSILHVPVANCGETVSTAMKGLPGRYRRVMGRRLRGDNRLRRRGGGIRESSSRVVTATAVGITGAAAMVEPEGQV